MPSHSLILREHCRRLGRPGLAGAVLLALCLLWALFGLWPASRDLQQLEARAEAARERVLRVARGVEVAPALPGRELASLQENLPAQQEATAAIERIYATAAQEGIALARGEYALALDPQTRLARYQMLLPVRGSYPQLRSFLAAVRRQLPALVLEDIDLQRKRIADSELEGRLRMALYLTR